VRKFFRGENGRVGSCPRQTEEGLRKGRNLPSWGKKSRQRVCAVNGGVDGDAMRGKGRGR